MSKLAVWCAVVFVALASLSGGPAASAVDSVADRTDALANQQKDRIRELGTLALGAPEGLPFRRVDGTTGLASLVLPPRDRPYSVPELAVRFPDSVVRVDDRVFLLNDDLIVGQGARLVVAADHVAELRLLSDRNRFVTLTSWLGEIDIVGAPWRRVQVASWDPAARGPDRRLDDGRSWLHTRRGRLSIQWADLDYLGFATGSVSGVAWEGRPDDPSRGDVTGSRFRHNYFGAYTFEAVAMRWIGNVFAANVGYGFDPHDHSDHFVVRFNAAYGNGTHGIIFSRGCRFNEISFNVSYGNGKHGIVLDDGPNLNPDGSPRERQGIPSDDNVVAANLVWNNEVGIVLDGGTRNVIRGNAILGNRIGIRMKDAVSGNEVTGNRIVASAEYGLYLYNGSDDNRVVENVVTGARTGLVVKDSTGNHVEHNRFERIQRQAMTFSGEVGETAIVGNAIADAATAIDLKDATGTDSVRQEGNTVPTAHPDPSRHPVWRWLVWSLVLVTPVLAAPWWGKGIVALKRRVARLPRPA